MGLRAEIESDLAETLEGDFGLPIELVEPVTGNIINKNANNPELPLMGQVVYDTVTENPETGPQVEIGKPNCSLRISSLSAYPSDVNYGKWFIKIPISVIDSTMKTYSVIRPPVHGKSIGFITLYLGKVQQS